MRCEARSRPSLSTIAPPPPRRPPPPPPAGVEDGRQVAELDRAVGHRVQARRLVELGGAADVEGTHGELRAGLADRLCGDHADRLADIDRRAAGEIAPVALAAHAMLALADQRRADV